MAGAKGRSGGQNRKTTAQLKAEGGYKSHRHKDRAVVKPSDVKKPNHFGKLGSTLWDRVVKSLPKEALATIDTDALVAYCDMAELYEKTRPLVMADPLNKEARICFMSALDRMDKLGRQFGWTPQSRAGLTIPNQAEEEDNPIDILLERMGASNN